jgi:hypothetical protein
MAQHNFKPVSRRTGMKFLHLSMALVLCNPGLIMCSKSEEEHHTPVAKTVTETTPSRRPSTDEQSTPPSTAPVAPAVPTIVPITDEVHFCATNSDGGHSVLPELLKGDQGLNSEIESWEKAAQALFDQLSNTRDALLTTAKAYTGLKALLANSEAPMTDLKTRAANILNQIPASYRRQGQEILTNYFNIVASRSQLEQFMEPTKWGIERLRAKYLIQLNVNAGNTLLGVGDYYLPGVDIEIATESTSLVYKLALSGETVFNSLVRAAARTPLLHPREAYVETVRCTLGRAIISKLTLNQNILGNEGRALPISNDENFCLGAKAEDLKTLAERDSNVSRELQLRAIFAKSLPEIATKMSKGTRTFLRNSGLQSHIAMLAGFPANLSVIDQNLKEKGQSEIDENAFSHAFGEIDQLVNAEYLSHRPWESLRGIWRAPAIQAKLTSIFDNCGIKLIDEHRTAVTVDAYWTNLMRSDDAVFLINIYSDLNSLPGRWLDLDRAQLQATLRNYILKKKVDASMRAFAYLVDYLVDKDAADPDQMMTVVYDDVSTLLTSEYQKIWASNADLQKWLDSTADQIFEAKSSAESFQLMRTSFIEDLIKAADGVDKIMDPNRQAATLPYDEKAVLTALTGPIQKLSRDNMRRYNLLKNEHDPAKRHALWEKISAMNEAEAKARGATCEPLGRGQRMVGFFTGWIWAEKTSQQTVANQDCQAMKEIAEAIGADRTVKPDDLSHTYLSIQHNLDIAAADEFVNLYRSLLVSGIESEYRLLDFPLNASQKDNGITLDFPLFPDYKKDETKLWQKLVRVHDAQALEPDVVIALQASVKSLDGYLKTVVHAKNEQDLYFFITRTNVINTILGQNLIEQMAILDDLNPVDSGAQVSKVLESDKGFVFPTLLKYHLSLQEAWTRKEELHKDLWDEFVNTTAMIPIQGLLWGWAAKTAFGIWPRWTGLPAASSMINAVGNRLSPLIAAHADYTTALIAGLLGQSAFAWHDFNAELGNLDLLHLSDGAGIVAPGSPFPLIEEDNFFRQKTLFEEGSSNALSELMQNGALLFVPLGIAHGARFYSGGVRSYRMWWENNWDRSGSILRGGYRSVLHFRVQNRLKQLSLDLAILGNPKIELGQLQSARDRAWKAARFVVGRRTVDEAYEHIITAIGSDAESFANNPNLQQEYVYAMYDRSGTVPQLEAIYQEYLRIKPGVQQ